MQKQAVTQLLIGIGLPAQSDPDDLGRTWLDCENGRSCQQIGTGLIDILAIDLSPIHCLQLDHYRLIAVVLNRQRRAFLLRRQFDPDWIDLKGAGPEQAWVEQRKDDGNGCDPGPACKL